jgi:outer membrane protein assembly factor BamB
VLDRNNLGQFNSGFDNVVQTIGPDGRSGGYDTPVYFNGRVFYGASGGSLESFDVSNGMLSSTGQTTAATFDFPGANPAVSANGTSDGIVWAIGPAGDGHAILYAYSTDDLGTALYTSDDAGSRDRAATRVKFSTPVIADGKVIVGTDGKVEIYGLL